MPTRRSRREPPPVEVYSALVYHGMGLVPKIKKELSELLEKDGYANVSEAVGKDVEL